MHPIIEITRTDANRLFKYHWKVCLLSSQRPERQGLAISQRKAIKRAYRALHGLTDDTVELRLPEKRTEFDEDIQRMAGYGK